MKTGDSPTTAPIHTTKDQLAAWRAERGLTMAAVAKRCGCNESTISRYLAGTMTGDVEALDNAVRDMMQAEARRQTWSEIYFETRGTQVTQSLLDLIRETCDIGLVTGAAGLGKTTACERYAASHESAILITLSEGAGDNWSVVRAIFDRLEMRNWKRRKNGPTRAQTIEERLRGSERLLIVDNAQRATLSGIRWLFDLHDSTGIPIALVGNPEVLDRVAGSDQLHSRIGLRVDVGRRNGKADLAWLDDAAGHLLGAMWPDAPAEVKLLAQEAAREPGHLRRLVKQLRIAIRLAAAPTWRRSQAAAFVESRALVGTQVDKE